VGRVRRQAGGAELATCSRHRISLLNRFWQAQKLTGTVNFANWALYIDPSHQTLKNFTASTGIKVNYSEVIQDDSSFFAKIHPVLAAGEPTGSACPGSSPACCSPSSRSPPTTSTPRSSAGRATP
jgi:hypothetical protein